MHHRLLKSRSILQVILKTSSKTILEKIFFNFWSLHSRIYGQETRIIDKVFTNIHVLCGFIDSFFCNQTQICFLLKKEVIQNRNTRYYFGLYISELSQYYTFIHYSFLVYIPIHYPTLNSIFYKALLFFQQRFFYCYSY